MPALRKYGLVSDSSGPSGQGKDEMREQRQPREARAIRSVSLTGSRDYNTGANDKKNLIFEVTKSPRAPEYTIHYVTTKSDGLKQASTSHQL